MNLKKKTNLVRKSGRESCANEKVFREQAKAKLGPSEISRGKTIFGDGCWWGKTPNPTRNILNKRLKTQGRRSIAKKEKKGANCKIQTVKRPTRK